MKAETFIGITAENTFFSAYKVIDSNNYKTRIVWQLTTRTIVLESIPINIVKQHLSISYMNNKMQVSTRKFDGRISVREQTPNPGRQITERSWFYLSGLFIYTAFCFYFLIYRNLFIYIVYFLIYSFYFFLNILFIY